MKGNKEYEDDPDYPVIRRILAVHQEDLEVAEMYPDVKRWKDSKAYGLLKKLAEEGYLIPVNKGRYAKYKIK